jgi:hypothetical protein
MITVTRSNRLLRDMGQWAETYLGQLKELLKLLPERDKIQTPGGRELHTSTSTIGKNEITKCLRVP